MVIERFAVYLVVLDPTVGAEMQKTRPCVVISPDELNRNLQTVIVAPMTGVSRGVPFRVPSEFAGKRGQVALDHMRAVDKRRLVKRLGKLDQPTGAAVIQALLDLFS